MGIIFHGWQHYQYNTGHFRQETLNGIDLLTGQSTTPFLLSVHNWCRPAVVYAAVQAHILFYSLGPHIE